LKEEEIYITSVVKYLPQKYVTPQLTDIEHGRVHLFDQLRVLKPSIVVLLGRIAVEGVLGRKPLIVKEHGTVIQKNDIVYFITLHPAAPLYAPKLGVLIETDFNKLGRLVRKIKRPPLSTCQNNEKKVLSGN
jgi:DNA polymerase